ncbi:MAG: hypothetical protein J6X66_01620 [Lachnospiraceae bacterium]|nr:hypothetical protein [Lachnospiraceae bacterium]
MGNPLRNAGGKELQRNKQMNEIPMHLIGVNLSAEEDITSDIFEYFRYRYMQEKNSNS